MLHSAAAPSSFLPGLHDLQLLEELLRGVLDVSLTGLIVYRPVYDSDGSGSVVDFAFAYVNPAAQRMLSLPEQPALTHLQQWPRSKAYGTFAFHLHAFESGEPGQHDVQYQADGYQNCYRLAARRSGQSLLVSLSDTPDQPRNLIEVAQAQADVQRQGQQLQWLFMEAPAAICILTGPDFVFELVNPGYQRLLPGRQLLGLPFVEAVPELAASPIPGLLRQVYQTGETCVAHELPLMLARHQDAPMEEIYWSFTYQARHNGQGAIDGVFVFAQDVTPQVLARRLVEEREESFRLMADNAPAMLWVTDREGYCTYLNQPWYTFTGQSTAEALGMGWVGAIHPDDAPEAAAAFVESNTHQVPYHRLFRLRRHDGEYRWVTDSGLPHFSEAGEFEGMVGTVIDVHEQKLAELALQRLTKKLRTSRDKAQALNAELQTANDQLTRTNVDLDNFIYTASHDLKAPITNIEGLVSVLAGELPTKDRSGEVTYILELMQSAVDRFKSTINHLTDVSKLQKEHGQAVSQVMLAEVVEDVRLDLAPLLQEADAQLKVDVLRCPVVAFSEKNLRSVVYNLLSNALKYRHPDRPAQVSLHCHTEDGYVVLSVRDNGLGIDLTRDRQLFQMFQRFHTHVEGSGVGLYMVKKMVENAGGKIEVESEVGVGSTFTVYFKH